MAEDWDYYWTEAFDDAKERHPVYDPEDYYTSGRVSKAWPGKESPEWWAENGPKFVQSWTKWRDTCGLTLWEYPNEDGVLRPAIEVEVWAYGPDDLSIRSIIDRVYVDNEDRLYIVDLKTGSQTPAWPQQLAFNNLGLRSTFDVDASFGGFWKARAGGVDKWHPIDRATYSDQWLFELAWKAREIRDQQLFVPQPTNLCNSACGVRAFCVAMGGDPSQFEQDATLTHNEGNTE